VRKFLIDLDLDPHYDDEALEGLSLVVPAVDIVGLLKQIHAAGLDTIRHDSITNRFVDTMVDLEKQIEALKGPK
jgi:hypothetical protein